MLKEKVLLIGLILILMNSCATNDSGYKTSFDTKIESVVAKINDDSEADDIFVIMNKYPEDSPEQYICDYLGKMICAEATNYNELKIITRDYYKEIIEEVKFQATSITNSDTKAEIGEFYNANKIINISIIDNNIDIDMYIDIVNIETGEISSYIEIIPKTNELVVQINRIIDANEKIINEQQKKLYVLQEQINTEKKRMQELFENSVVELNDKLAEEEAEKERILKEIDEEIRKKSEILSNYNLQYSSRQEQLVEYDRKIEAVIKRINRQDDIIANYIINGMTIKEVQSMLGENFYPSDSTVTGQIRTALGAVPNSVYHVQSGNYLIMFSETMHVSGYYDLIEEKGYYRNTR